METAEREIVYPKNAVDEAEKVEELGESEDYKLEAPLPEQPEETKALSPKVDAVIQHKDVDDEGPPLNTELQQGLRILKGLMTDSNKTVNWPFMDPVDASLPGLEDYYDKISSPMWLKKMKEKFDERKYETITEFVADFRLMLENCYRFNGPDHYVSKRGQRLETMLEQKLTLLPRDLRFKTSIEATTSQVKDSNAFRETALGSRRRNKNLTPHDSSLLLSQLREEEVQREKDLRKQMIADKKAAHEAYMNELLEWENELLGEPFKTYIKGMWELPQIGHFLYLCQEPLNIGEVSQHELERSFCMTRESSTLQKVMTALLSTPHQRTKFDKKKMMSYNTWEEKLRIRLRQWYKVFDDQHLDIDKASEKLGLDPYFFDVVGKKNPLEKKRFHQLSYYRQIWIVKSLCDNCLENQESLRDAIEFQPFEDQRDYLLGVDDKGNRYIHFPQFCGADLRIYRQSKFKEPVYSASDPEDNADKTKNTNLEDTEIKTPKKKRKKKRSQQRRKKAVKVQQESKPTREELQQCSDASGDEAAMSDTSVCSGSMTSANVNNSCSSTRESSPAVFIDRTNSDSSLSTKVGRKMRNGLVRELEKGFTGFSPRKKRLLSRTYNLDELEQCSDDSQLRLLNNSSSEYTRNETINESAKSWKNENHTPECKKDGSDISRLGVASPWCDEDNSTCDISKIGVSSLWCDDDNSTCDSTCSDSLPGSSAITVNTRTTDNNCDIDRKVAENSDKGCGSLQSENSIIHSGSFNMNSSLEKNSVQVTVKNIKSEPPDKNRDGSNECPDNENTLKDNNKTEEKYDEVHLSSETCINNTSCAINTNQQEKEVGDSLTVKKEEQTFKSEESKSACISHLDGEDLSMDKVEQMDENHSEAEDSLENIENPKKCDDGDDGSKEEKNIGISQYRPDHTYSNINSSVAAKQEDEEEEEEDEEEELLPQLGEFELVGDTVEDLRNLVSKFAEPEPIIVKKGKKKKIVKPPARKKCIIDLHAQLEFLLHELEPWESKLVQATKKARLRMRKEKDDYKEEKQDVWESASEETASSTDSGEGSDVDSEADKPDLLIIKEKVNRSLKKKTSVQDSDSSSMDISMETDISSRGRIRKRRIIPNNTEDQGIKKKKVPTATLR